MALQVAFGDARHLGVDRRQDLTAHLDQGHVEAAVDQVFRRFQADEAATHHHRAGLRPHCLEPGIPVHPGEEGRASFDPLADRSRVRHRADLEDARQVDARQRRPDRRRPGRQHQLVVGLGAHLAGGDITQLDSLALRRDADGLAAGSHVDGELRAERVLVRHHEAGFLFDHAADVVGQPAVGVRNIGPALDHEDLGVLVQPAQARRTGCAAGHTTDDDDFHAFSLLWVSERQRMGAPRQAMMFTPPSTYSVSPDRRRA